jgi:predicted HicB family RNase H-like nuclease
MEYKGYHAKICYSAEDGCFVGEIVGINDVLAFHGYSVSELKKMSHQCIDNYLELCAKIGKEPDKEYRGMFNVRILPELHRLAVMEAANRNITLNQLVSDILASALQQA